MVMARSSLFLLLALFFNHVLCTPVREPEKHSVVIVGAGVAGISAGASLLQAGVQDVVILEASDRIGGRIHTVQFGGVQVDKGAEFVHGEKDNAVYELVSPYKDQFLASYKNTYFHPEQHMFTNTAGRQFNNTAMYDLVYEAYEELEYEDGSHLNGTVLEFFNSRMDSLLEREHVDPKLGEAINHIVELMHCSYAACDSLADLGASTFSDYLENQGDLSLTWKSTGYQVLFDFLTKKFPIAAEELPVVNQTRFGKQVDKVQVEEDGSVRVSCSDGSTYLADHVIMTTSLGVLKKHAADMFHPALPARHTTAIQTIGIGCVAKVFILFPTRWWPKDINIIMPLFSKDELKEFKENSTHGHWTGDTTGFYPVMKHERMLCLWYSGESCRTLERLSEEEVLEGVLELLQKTMGNKFTIPRPESILRSTWGSNPYTLGSYSFNTVESDKQNVTHNDLAQPILHGNKPVILFAGEATHPHYYSTVHGALATGRREAKHILDYMKQKS